MSTLLLPALKLLVLSLANSAEREKAADVITPVKIEQSGTFNDNENQDGWAAENAIDLKPDTASCTKPGSDGKAWLKVTLDQLYCVRQVVEKDVNDSPRTTWSCSNTDCSCEGDNCFKLNLTVSAAYPHSQCCYHPPDSDCIQGNTVKLELVKEFDDDNYDCKFTVHELSVTGKDLRPCEADIPACKVREEISKIAEKAKNIRSVKEQKAVSEEVRNLARESSALMNTEDILQTSQGIVDKVIDYSRKIDLIEEVRSNVLKTIDYIHKSTPANELAKNSAALTLRSSVKNLADKISKDTAESENFFKEQTMAVLVKKSTGDYISFTVTGEKDKFNKTSLIDNAKDGANLFSAKVQGKKEKSPLTAILYNTSKFYPDVNTTQDLTQALTKKFINLTEAKRNVNIIVSVVTEISYGESTELLENLEMNFTVEEEKPRVHYKMHLQTLDYECAFYQAENKTWITGKKSGCNKNITKLEVQGKEKSLVSCKCPRTRMTRSINYSGVKSSFAVLMSFDSDYDPREGTVTNILLGISLVSLLFTIIAYIPVEKTMPVWMKLFFVISLIFSIIIFYLMELAVLYELEVKKKDRPSENETASVPCLVIAFLMNYFWLCQMAWMVCWAVVIHHLVTKVFNCLHVPRFMLKFNFPSWGIPLIFPTIGMILGQVRQDGFANPETCFVREIYGLGTFFIPVVVCVFFNIVIFMRVSWSLYGPKVETKGKTPASISASMKLKEQFIFSVRVMTLLGLSWIFGFCLILEGVNDIWMRWLFILFNCPQGTFIFILDVVLNENLRKVWRRLLQKSWPVKTNVNPIYITAVTRVPRPNKPAASRAIGGRPKTLPKAL